MKGLFKVFTILTPRQVRNCVILIFMMLVGAVFETLGIGLLYPLIKIIGTPTFLSEHEGIAKIVGIFGVKTHKELIIFSTLGMLFVYITKNAYTILQLKLQLRFVTNLQKTFVTDLYSLYLHKPYLYHLNTNSAILMRNVTESTNCVFNSVLLLTLTMLSEVFIVLVIWSFLLLMNWVIALFIALFIGPTAFFILKFFRKNTIIQSKIRNKNATDVNKWLHQGLGSIKETKVMCTEEFFCRYFEAAYAKYSESQKYSTFLANMPRSAVEVMAMSGILLLIIIQILLGQPTQTLIPTLGVLAIAATRLMPSMTRIMSSFNTIKFNLVHLDNVYDDIMTVRKQEHLKEQGKLQKKTDSFFFKDKIEVKGLTFRYPGTEVDVIENVSFSIPKSAFVGIVGPSGAGKTTFVDILLGLLPPTSGCICVDGIDIEKNITGWLSNIAYVPQSIYLVDGTIQENIALGHKEEDIDAQKIERAMKMAEIYDFVEGLPQKEKTNVGEMGSHLSGGQKQRIGIARALYQEPSVLVLDEATSALDNETEKSITNTILKLKNSITIISIAHRLSTLENCDFKIHFENGKAFRI